MLDSPSPQALVPAEVRSGRHPALVYLARLAPGSRRTMRESLEEIARLVSGGTSDALSLPWQDLGYQHTMAIRARLAESKAPATVNKMLSALRGVLREAWRLGLMGAESYHRAVDLPPVRGERLLSGRALIETEIRALFHACSEDASAAGRRDAALLAVLYGCGVRRSEAVGLDTGDLDPSGTLRVRAGKGAKDRLAHVPPSSARVLAEWLAVRGSAPGALFVPVNKAGRLTLRRMTDQAVLGILRKRALQAGVRSFSPHDLRRTFISDLLDAGADLVTVQKMAGHANVTTTARYDRRPEEARRRAAALLRIPDEAGVTGAAAEIPYAPR